MRLSVTIWGVNEQANRMHLAEQVTAARRRKFKTVDKARMAANVARGTWEKVERGDAVKDFSLAAIEEALGWPPGRAQSILEGTGEQASEQGDIDIMATLREVQQELRDAQRRLDEAVRAQHPELSRNEAAWLRKQIGDAEIDDATRERLLAALEETG